MQFPLSIFLVTALTTGALAEVTFNDDIRPILSDKCFFCHGPDAANQKANLRLDTFEGATKDGAIVPGKPLESELILRVSSHDPDEHMPPPEAKIGLLTKEEIATLTEWIASGATYQPHWAFLPVPDKPADKTSIDDFVAANLAQHNLTLQHEAERTRLIRRVTFDLTGLPPTPGEITAFLADTSPDAYEKLVDRLLASPRYGERMAVDWLDLARYADTYGMQVDRDREVWPYRDWVINAFNKNQPYDQFMTWQLAGDLLPNPTDEQILATAFNRLHQQKVEGGSVEEEFRVEYVADRTHTFGTTFLGLTLECSRCHDHKFDPISHVEYYQLSAFFQNIDEAGPSVPVEVLGFDAAPEAGDQIAVVENEARAREITDYRIRKRRETLGAAGSKSTLEQMMQQPKEAGRKDFNLLIKGDVQGSVEAIIAALDKLGTDEVGARIIHAGVGGISESDITLSEASGAAVIGFNVRAHREARDAAERAGIEIRYYNIIYNLVDDIKAAMWGLLSPTLRENMLGNAEILEVCNITKVGKIAGCRVTDGHVERGAKVRLIRDNVVIHEGSLGTLKRFKDEVREVQAGQECGMAFENYQDIRAGDIIECYRVEEIARTL